MAKRREYLLLLQAEIGHAHECDAAHRESVQVHETVDGQTVWKGDVEVFDLVGHAEAKICYAWWYDDRVKVARVVTVLGKPPVSSPAMAVMSAVFFDAQPVNPGQRCVTQNHTSKRGR